MKKYDVNTELNEYWISQINACLTHQLTVNFPELDISVVSYTEQHERNRYAPSFVLSVDGERTEVVCRMVGFSGKAGSGKDTSADIYRSIIQELISQRMESSSKLDTNYIIHRDAFARVLKEICALLSDTPVEYFNTQEGKKEFNEFLGMLNRKAAQLVGTECFRDNFEDGIWVKTVLNSFIREIIQQQIEFSLVHAVTPKTVATLIVSDVRFENEANMFRALEGILSIVINENQVIDEEVDAHRSEQLFDFDDEDLIIRNSGKELLQLTDEIFQVFMGNKN